MTNDVVWIEDEKALLKAAQLVWAANKYFVLACSQQTYNQIRESLKQDQLNLGKVYQLLQKTDAEFRTTPSSELPAIKNALYHIAGYFKKLLSKSERDEIIHWIEQDPHRALIRLEALTQTHQVTYLLPARIWPRLRAEAFALIPVRFKHDGVVYQPNQLIWQETYLTHY